MHDKTETLESLLKPSVRTASTLDRIPRKTPDAADENGEESCAAFAYLRGLHDRSLSLELKFRNGNTTSFTYSWLGTISYDPSVGVLLKFTGDLVYLVLIRGSNLDAITPGRAVNLTDRGLNRHRIVWVREMDESELRRAEEGEPTIDRIQVAEFASNEELQEWLKRHAATFHQ